MRRSLVVHRASGAAALLALFACAGPGGAPDAELLAYIDGIKAVPP